VAAVELRFPIMSEDDPDAEGVVATWYARDGETVAAGQVVAEVMVEKVSNDVEAPVAGVLRVLAAEEQAVRQGDVIATIEA
jgi:pyruvate/2-oxoglutarate dehydrogenase complex dihydrolipoamide acyltransferase (E2) component